MSEPFIGQINIFPYDFAPVNYLPCNGQLLSISAFDALYSIIGTTYGGDGRSTFALPDLRGRVPIGQGDAPGLTPRFIGQRLGAETVSLTVNQLPSPKHAFNATAAPPSQIEPSNALPAAGGQTIYAESVPSR